MQRKDTHSIWIDLTIFACVFAFSLFSGKRLFSHPESKRPDAVRGPAEDLQNNDSRTPASFTPPSTESVLQLGCVPSNSEPHHLKTKLNLVRLSGDLCEKGKKVKILDGSAINEANGAEINAFVDRPTKKLATNYFPLKNGKNTILLEYVLSNGKRQKTQVDIIRD